MTYRILRTSEQIVVLTPVARELLKISRDPNDINLLPENYLALMERQFTPMVVSLSEGDNVIGLVFAKERRVAGIGNGIAKIGDFSGRGGILCQKGREYSVINAALQAIQSLPRIHALRIRTNEELEVDTGLSCGGNPDFLIKKSGPHRAQPDLLELPMDYEGFLASVGQHTRRNMRYYRRLVAAEGFRYDEADGRNFIPAKTIHQLNRISQYAKRPASLDRCLELIDRQNHPFYAMLRDRTGEPISMLAGWIADDMLTVATQFNDPKYRRLSLSLVLRAYTIESAISRGLRLLYFYGGSSEMLGRHCLERQIFDLNIDRKHCVYGAIKWLASVWARTVSLAGRKPSQSTIRLAGAYYAN